MRNRKIFVFFIMFALMFSSICGFAESPDEIIASGMCGDNLTWTLAGNGVLTISGEGKMYSWYYLSNKAPWFEYRNSIKEVALETGVMDIGDWAFLGCEALKSIVIPDGVTIIGKKAFSCCEALKSIVIPDSMSYICDYAFYDCVNLESITLNEGITNIAQGTFYNCRNLTSVNIPASVEEIGYEAFRGCKGLKTVKIPASVTKIDSAFRSCSSELVFCVEPGSYAEKYANKNGFRHTSGDPADLSEQEIVAVPLGPQCAAGDYVTFGTYPQTATGDDNTPIEWLVLARYEQYALLISRYGLDYQCYNNYKYKKVDITWEHCSLRSWLNDTFLNKAFTDEEQQIILTVTIDNSQSQCCSDYKTIGGNDTQDKIFLGSSCPSSSSFKRLASMQ